MYEFTHHMAASVEDALENLGEGKFLAGGHTLIPTLKQRLAMPGHLVDLNRLDALKGIDDKGDVLAIGAMTRHYEVAQSRLVAEQVPGLEKLASWIGDPAVRHRGTIGGSVANNDPAADYPAACLALEGVILTNRRRIKADDYFTGLFTTALEEDELIVAVEFPKNRLYYGKFPHPASRYAMVGVGIVKSAQGVRVAVTGCGADGVFRWREAEKALAANFSPQAIAEMKPDVSGISGDIHGSAEYRAHLVGVMARRALEG